MGYYRQGQPWYDRITVQQLRDALDDPRLPESFFVEGVHGYPALAIRTDETDKEDPDGFWYIGYIDLFDGTYHPRKRGACDGINPAVGEGEQVTDPETWENGERLTPHDVYVRELYARIADLESRIAQEQAAA